MQIACTPRLVRPCELQVGLLKYSVYEYMPLTPQTPDHRLTIYPLHELRHPSNLAMDSGLSRDVIVLDAI
jgi:hypothetical protein